MKYKAVPMYTLADSRLEGAGFTRTLSASMGFTLLEIITYVGLVSALLVGAWSGVFYIMRNMTINAHELQSHQDIAFLEDKLRWAGFGAAAVHTTSTSISFVRPDLGSSSPLTTAVRADGQIVLQRGGSVPVSLLPGHMVSAAAGFDPFTYEAAVHGLYLRLTVDDHVVSRYMPLR